MQFQSLCWKDPLEKEMVICSNILAWKISCTEGPGWLQSLGSKRVGHDWVPMFAGRNCKCYIRTSYWIFENLKLKASMEFKKTDFVMFGEWFLFLLRRIPKNITITSKSPCVADPLKYSWWGYWRIDKAENG